MNNKNISFSWLRIMCVAVVALFSMSATAQKNDKTIYSVVEEMCLFLISVDSFLLIS